MHTPQEYIKFIFSFIRCIPHIIIFYFHKNKFIIRIDIDRGLDDMGINYREPFGLVYLLTFCEHFRNLFYYRTRPYSFLLDIICPQIRTLKIQTKNIGEGFILVHGFASAIGGLTIGKNCKVYQQVTIGGTKTGIPVIGDNVTVYPGAIIIGNVKIGNNVVIGANTTIFQDVPDNCTVLPVAPRMMRWKPNQEDSSN